MAFVIFDPLRRPSRREPFDLVADAACLQEASKEVTEHIVQCLQLKGYCTLNCGFAEERLKGIQALVNETEVASKFSRVAPLLHKGLLGYEASQTLLEVGGSSEVTSTDLQAVESVVGSLSKIIIGAASHDDAWNFRCSSQSSSYLFKSSSLPIDIDESDLSIKELHRWWSLFTNRRVMLCVFLGPGDGYLELRPYDEDANMVDAYMQPGHVALIRTDVFQSKYIPRSDSATVLTTFAVIDRQLSVLTRNQDFYYIPPAAVDLHNMLAERMKDLKMEEEDGQEYPDIPRSLVRIMNHTYYRRQQVAVRGCALRMCRTWSSDASFYHFVTSTDHVTHVPLSRWDHERVYDSSSEEPWHLIQPKTRCRHGSFMDGVALFDCKAFGISAAEAGGMDPHQRHMLETGLESLNRAGHEKANLMNLICSVYIGISNMEWSFADKTADVGVFGATGGAPSICCGRFSFCLGLRGASVAVDLEGAGGLAATYWGADSVQNKGKGRVHDWAVSAGLRILLASKFWPELDARGFLSKTGRCFTFDATADGCVMADGCGALTLQDFNGLVSYDDDGRVVEDLQERCDDKPFEGFIVAGALMTSGKAAALTAPSSIGYQETLQQAARLAGLQPADIDVVNCHGASTLMSDAVELTATAKTLRGGSDAREPLVVTCDKTLYGNAVEGAGILSVSLALNCLKRGAVAPMNHLSQINPYMGSVDSVCMATEILSCGSNAFQGVTAHGLGGINCNVVLFGRQEADVDEKPWEQN